MKSNRIIDIHTHLGSSVVFGVEVTEEELLKVMDENNIEISIVQPFPDAPDAKKVHDQIAEFARRNPGRIFGLTSISPHVGEEEYVTEVERCIKDLHFVGVKMHPAGYPVLPLSGAGKLIARTAHRLRVPLMIHTGAGNLFSLPSLSIPLAREWPDLSIILSHGGASVYSSEAYVAAIECDNIFLDTSWCNIMDSQWLINELGGNRIMFASDLPVNVSVELAKYRSIRLTNRQLQLCMSKTAIKVFNLKF